LLWYRPTARSANPNEGLNVRLLNPDEITISSGVTITLSYDQTATDVTILSGGTLQADAGSQADQVTILNGGYALGEGGLLVGVTVQSGGVALVSDGVLSGVTVTAGGEVNVLGDGKELGASIGGDDANDVLDPDATGSGFVVSSGGRLSVHPKASASGVVVSSGALLVDWIATSGSVFASGALSSVTILPGGDEALAYDIYSGTAVSGLKIDKGGLFDVLSGGVIEQATLEPGRPAGLGGSGVSQNGLGGLGYIYSGGLASRTMVKSGAEQYVYSSGLAKGTLISKGGSEYVFTAGVSISAAVLAGGAEFVYSGGEAEGTTVSKGGALELRPDGVLSNVTILAAADFDLVSGANVSGATLSARVVQAAETISGATLSSGAVVDLFDQVVVGGGDIVVGSGALASGTMVSGGGSNTVLAHGVASATTVYGGSVLVVTSGGDASGGVILGGGLDILLKGGKEGAITVSSGGALELATPIHSGPHIVPPGMVTATEVISGVTLLSGALLEALPASPVAAFAQAIAAHAPAGPAPLAAPDGRDARAPLSGPLVAFATSSIA
jgi:autotransporter passenger strand-loop-strand repeat protein